MLDIAKTRRETMRWIVILTLYNARPYGACAELILQTVQGMFHDATQKEVLNEMNYLHERELIKNNKQPNGHYHAELTRWGVDLAEYTVECEPGIARPEKYWQN